MVDDATPPQTLAEITAAIEGEVSPRRLEHVLAVAELAASLGPSWGVDEDRARRMGLLHDYAREWSEVQLLVAAQEYDIAVSDFDHQNPGMLHGPVAAEIAKRDFGLEPEPCLAIAAHTTGRIGMGPFDLVLFVADHAAEGRRGDGPPRWRELARTNLKGAALDILDEVLQRAVRRRAPVSPIMVEARNDLLRRERPNSQ